MVEENKLVNILMFLGAKQIEIANGKSKNELYGVRLELEVSLLMSRLKSWVDSWFKNKEKIFKNNYISFNYLKSLEAVILQYLRTVSA